MVLVALLAGLTASTAFEAAAQRDVLRWGELPALPDAIGFAGVFAGVSNDALIVAGGANFPTGPPWDGHPKRWHDRIFVLPNPDASWQTGFQLPRPLAYGVSATWGNTLICLGGGDQERHSSCSTCIPPPA